jgi:hypothetical protein
MIFQQHYIVQTLLAVTLVLTVISVATPDWSKAGDKDINEHTGLWKLCTARGSNGGSKCTDLNEKFLKTSPIKMSMLSAVRAMGIMACAFAFIALTCSLVCTKKYVTVLFSALTVASSVAALVIYATEIMKDMNKDSTGDTKSKYGFSFWLQLVAAFLAVIATVVPLRPGYIHSVTSITNIGKT